MTEARRSWDLARNDDGSPGWLLETRIEALKEAFLRRSDRSSEWFQREIDWLFEDHKKYTVRSKT